MPLRAVAGSWVGGTPIAQRRAKRALDLVAVTGTIRREEGGCMLHRLAQPSSQLDQRVLLGGTARACRAGAPSAEPGAGSAGPGAAQRRRLI
jgi:hypothetical protein